MDLIPGSLRGKFGTTTATTAGALVGVPDGQAQARRKINITNNSGASVSLGFAGAPSSERWEVLTGAMINTAISLPIYAYGTGSVSWFDELN